MDWRRGIMAHAVVLSTNHQENRRRLVSSACSNLTFTFHGAEFAFAVAFPFPSPNAARDSLIRTALTRSKIKQTWDSNCTANWILCGWPVMVTILSPSLPPGGGGPASASIILMCAWLRSRISFILFPPLPMMLPTRLFGIKICCVCCCWGGLKWAGGVYGLVP